MAETRDVFGDELRRLLEQVNNPGPMYEGWENPANKPGDKAGNGVYSTPFDRQGGSEVAQQELDAQAEDILKRFLGGKGYGREAIDELLKVLKGETQSPADPGANAPAFDVNEQFRYGGGLSANTTAPATTTQQAALSNNADWLKFQQWLSAEDEKKRKEEEEKKRSEEGDKEEKEMSALAQKIAPAILSAVDSIVDQKLSSLGVRAAQAASAPAQTQAPSAGTDWRNLPGVNVPPGMGTTAQAAYSAGEAPTQGIASKFINEAMSALSGIENQYVRGQVQEELKTVYAGILSGHPVSIQHPVLRKIADQTGVQYTNFGIGGAN